MERTLDLETEEQMRNHAKTERSGLHHIERRWNADRLERNVEIRNHVKTERSGLN